MLNKYSAALLLLGSTTFSQTALAQTPQAAQRAQPQPELAADGTPTLIRLGAGTKAYAASQARQAIIEQLGLKTDDGLRALTTETDRLGFTHEKFQQYYKGIKVEHATYTAHSRRGTLESLSGKFERVGELSITPALAADAALRRALAFVGAKKYMWDAENDASLRPQGELVIVNRHRNLPPGQETGAPVLAWKFNVYAAQPLSRAYIYVDARTGEVVLSDAIIKHAAVTGTFATRYSGAQSSTTESINGSYRLRDATRGGGVQTFDAKRGSSYTAAVDFLDADNSWTEYDNANFDNAALDAHWGAQTVFDYWKNVQGRNSYDNAGAAIKSYVHFDDTPGDGVGYENAFWNGQVMTYGDGATRFKPLTCLDVCAHEIGHAICQNTANLVYANESGGLNEGFSDIWGAVVENYKAPGKPTWLIGEDIVKSTSYTCLRSMSNPGGAEALSRCPSYYKGNLWKASVTNPDPKLNDNGGVHTNSGVLNYWFYLLSAGKSGTNEAGNAYSVASLGIGAAANIAYRTESVYLTANSTFANARTYSIQAATDLYGAGSAQVTAVTDAWFAVGVGAAAGGGTTTPPPTTGLSYCVSKGSSQAYEYINLVQLGSINRSSGADGGYYNGTALSTSVAAGSSQTISYRTGFPGAGYAEYFRIYADWNQDGDFLDAGEALVSSTNTAVVTTTRSATFTVPTTAKNGSVRLRIVMSNVSSVTSCGTYNYGETEDYTLSVSGGALDAPAAVAAAPATLGAATEPAALALYPNPATDRVHLSLSSGADLVAVAVYDVRGARVSGARYDGHGELNVRGLASGLYIVRASDGTKSYQLRFAKQ